MAFIPCENVITDNSVKQFLIRGAGTSSNPASASMELDCENRNLLSVGNATIFDGTAYIYGGDSTGYITELLSLSASGNTGESRSNLSYDVSSYAFVYFQINSTNGNMSSGFTNVVIS